MSAVPSGHVTRRWLLRPPAVIALAAATASLWALTAAGGYGLFLGMTVAVFVLAAAALDVCAGVTGMVSLGHAAFLGVGAYAHVILYTRGLPLPLAMAGGALIATAAGVVVALPAMRLSGSHLAIATLAWQVTADQVLGGWSTLTGGRMGLMVPEPELFGASLAAPERYAVWCFLLTALALVAITNFTGSRFGRAMRAVAHDARTAAAAGVDVTRTKALAFAVSAGFTGLAGALSCHLVERLSPRAFGVDVSIELLAMVVIGGSGSAFGAALGAALLVLLPQAFAPLADHQTLAVGAAMVLVLHVQPRGIAGALRRRVPPSPAGAV